jgi:CBS domain-containing protein
VKAGLVPLRVSQIMTREVISIGESAVVTEAAKLMKDNSIGSVVVIEDDEVVGILTERDFLNKIVAEGLSPRDVHVRDVMSMPVTTCTSDTPITTAVNIMREQKIRHLPIVDEGKLVGIVAGRDLTSLGWRIMVY